MELNATDRQILAKLREGRGTPRYLADELSRNTSYISQRLKRLREEEYVVRVHRGLYKHAEIEGTTVSAAKKAEALDKQELLTASTASGMPDSRNSQSQQNMLDELAVEVEFDTPDIKSAASHINQSGTDEEQDIVESVFHNLLWLLLRDGSVSNKELRDAGIRIGEHLPDTDFRDVQQYTTAIKQQLTTHPNIELQTVNKSRSLAYTDDSIAVRL